VSWLLRLPGLRRYGAQLNHAEQQVASLHAKVEGLRQRLAEDHADFAQRINDHKSRQLAAGVLRQVLAARHQALIASAARQDAAARELRFRQHSASYAAATATRVAPDKTSRVTIEGVSWCVPADGAPDGGLSDRIVRDEWLPFEDILATRELAMGEVMLDVGANIGTTSIPRVILGDVRCVYAAEPEPANYACLVENVVGNRLQGFVMPDRVAIGAADGEATMRVRGQIGTHHLVPGAAGSADIVVPVRTLDSWIAALGIEPASIAFVKVDTQGWESNVLRGAPGLLARPHIAWQIEVSPGLLKQAGSSTRELLDQLAAAFTHFIDLGARTTPRARPVAAMADALASLERRERRYTNVLMYSSRSA
jgi:FkbM family methyltransferase